MGVREKVMRTMKTFDYLVLGGGSAGIAGARKAAEFGAKVGLIEPHLIGGTCVNVGCVPKKIMFYAADYSDKLETSQSYGFQITGKDFSWKKLTKARCDYIKKLNDIYLSNLQKSNIELIQGYGHFTKDKNVEVNGELISAKHILIATGSRPLMPTNIPGFEYGINSDGFFSLEELPKNCVIVGAGYIATELAGILHSLGSQVTMLIRQDKVLRQFDSMISDNVTRNLEQANIKVMKNTQVLSVTRDEASKKLKISTDTGVTLNYVDKLLWAVGRSPNVEIGLENIGVQLKDGFINVDDFQNTSAPNIYAVGDVCGKVLLTPVAIAASRLLSSRIFNNKKDAKLDYTNVPSAIYAHPPAAFIGLSQEEAEKQYGKREIKVYESSFTPLHDSLLIHRKKFNIKLVCLLPTEKIVGLHMVGDGADEILQGFAVAIKMGATKKDFDKTVAIHPTSAEEVVLMK